MSPPRFDIRGTLLCDEPMSRHTSLKVGGPADIFAIPADVVDLQCLIGQLTAAGVPWLAVGRGYNLLVKDGGDVLGIYELCSGLPLWIIGDGKQTDVVLP